MSPDFLDPAGRVWAFDPNEGLASRSEAFDAIEDMKEKVRKVKDDGRNLEQELHETGLDLMDVHKELFSSLARPDELPHIQRFLTHQASRPSREMSLTESIQVLGSEVDESMQGYLAGVGNSERMVKRAEVDADAELMEDAQQPNEWTCAPAVLDFLLKSTSGVDEAPSFDDLVEETGASEEAGVLPKKLKSVADKYFSTQEIEGLDELRESLDSGYPVVVATTTEGSGHYLVLLDYSEDDDVFVGFCPEKGQIELSEGELAESWFMKGEGDEDIENWGLAILDDDHDKGEKDNDLYAETVHAEDERGEEIGNYASEEEAKKAAKEASLFEPGVSYVISTIRVKTSHGLPKRAALISQFRYTPDTETVYILKERGVKTGLVRRSDRALPQGPHAKRSPAVGKASLDSKIPLHAAAHHPGGTFEEIGTGKFQFRAKQGCGFDAYDGSTWNMMNSPVGVELAIAAPAPAVPAPAPDRIDCLKERARAFSKVKDNVSSEIRDLKDAVDSLVDDAEEAGLDVFSDDELKSELGAED